METLRVLRFVDRRSGHLPVCRIESDIVAVKRMMMMEGTTVIMMMSGDVHRNGRQMVLRSARRPHDSGDALNRERGYQQPKQKCLENAIHPV